MKTEQPSPEPITALPMVCGRTITADPAFYPHAEYGGNRLYFCTEYCLRAFQSDPDRFYTAHTKQREASGDRAGEEACDCKFNNDHGGHHAGNDL